MVAAGRGCRGKPRGEPRGTVAGRGWIGGKKNRPCIDGIGVMGVIGGGLIGGGLVEGVAYRGGLSRGGLIDGVACRGE